MKRSSLIALGLVLVLFGMLPGQEQRRANRGGRSYPPRLPQARSEVYKTTGDVELRMYVFEPKGHRPEEKRPAIVLFFGGGWRNGSPQQFEKQCEYFASRGMVAMTADYRVASRHDARAVDCVRDAKSAVRWVRANADRLGVDPERIAAGGGSAGGHIAACTAVIDDFDPEGEDLSVSSVPNALVLFNPAMSLAPRRGEEPLRELEQMKERAGVDPKAISPAHHVKRGLPPTVMFFGTDDRLLAGAEAFRERAVELGNRCEIQLWKGKGHGFFNFGRDENEAFVETTQAADRFLQSLGYLSGDGSVEEWLRASR